MRFINVRYTGVLSSLSSFHWNELMQSRGVRRPSVASRYFYNTHDSIANKLAHDGPHMVLNPRYAQGQGQGQRSRDTDTFCDCTKIATSTTNIDSIATKLAHDGPHMGLHPGCTQGQGQAQRSRDTDTFLTTRKSLLLPQT